MKYYQTRSLTDHINEVIDIWFEMNQNHITEESKKALKDTIRLTLTSYYGGYNG